MTSPQPTESLPGSLTPANSPSQTDMLQDPNPIDPITRGDFVLAVNGTPLPFSAHMIPKLFVAYVAASRADYYAAGDEAKGRGKYDEVFHEEVRHAIRDRSEIKDWMENNMDVHDEPADEIGVMLP